ncbi:MAG: Txe/YoeB family addiction module toxin [Chitinophagaceae bacterium]|nr:Txe/YoeB family addiction module toxin [Chitinophagaceae bacterium]
MKLVFQSNGWEDYLYWQQQDKKVLQRANELIKDTMRSSFKGIGKPEPLKGDLSGYWSRRITDEHRLIYTVRDKRLHILQCRFHYNNS